MGAPQPGCTEDPCAHADDGTDTSTPAPTSASSRAEVLADSATIREAMTSNATEIGLGNVARSKASRPAVKSFAERMVKDHTAMYDQWVSLAKANGLPGDVDGAAAIKATADRLGALSGAEFDRAYMSEMVQEHQTDIAKVQQVARRPMRPACASSPPTRCRSWSST